MSNKKKIHNLKKQTMKKIILFAAILVSLSSCWLNTNVVKQIRQKNKQNQEFTRINKQLIMFDSAQHCKKGDPYSCVIGQIGQADHTFTKWFNGSQYLYSCWDEGILVTSLINKDTTLIGIEAKICGQ